MCVLSDWLAWQDPSAAEAFPTGTCRMTRALTSRCAGQVSACQALDTCCHEVGNCRLTLRGRIAIRAYVLGALDCLTPPTPPPGGPVGNQKTGGIGGELIGDPEMCIFLIIGFYLLTL